MYNGAGTLYQLCERLAYSLSQLTHEFEIILVNDGSADESWERIQSLAASLSYVAGINLSRNFGQHNALLCGIREARFGAVVTIDDDLQNPPEEIPLLAAEYEKGFDVVYGTPRQGQHGVWRNMASRVTKRVLKHAMGAAVAGDVSAFRMFRTSLRDGFEHYRGAFVSIDVLLSWSARRYSSVKVELDERRQGQSNYTFRKLLTHALNMMTGFSNVPLQLASITGFLFTVFGFGVLVYVLVKLLIIGVVVPGFAFLASIIAIFSGAQLFAIGIIGEYLARMHFRIMDKPAYVIREQTNNPQGG